MAQGTFEKVVQLIIETIEKGYVDRSTKADPGGPTNYGITLKTFRAWRGNLALNRNALQMMPKSEAKEIYLANYWEPIRGDQLPLGFDFALFDFAINSGVGRAVIELQRILKVKKDGVIGVNTMNGIRNYVGGAIKLIADLSHARLKFMKGLSNWRYNKNGWTSRVKKVMSEAQTMVFASPERKPDLVVASRTPKAISQNVSVSKALFSKENATFLTVAIPALFGLLSDFQPAQYPIAAFVAGFGSFALYQAVKKVRTEAA